MYLSTILLDNLLINNKVIYDWKFKYKQQSYENNKRWIFNAIYFVCEKRYFKTRYKVITQ